MTARHAEPAALHAVAYPAACAAVSESTAALLAAVDADNARTAADVAAADEYERETTAALLAALDREDAENAALLAGEGGTT